MRIGWSYKHTDGCNDAKQSYYVRNAIGFFYANPTPTLWCIELFRNDAFYVTMPMAISRFLRPGQVVVGIGIAVTGWTLSDLLGCHGCWVSNSGHRGYTGKCNWAI